ncbi:hypothetical protein GDO81_008138 [Engystomops pustulosus]|uniref:Uncharacterized protein n=1 Tax=Engystomops pustulosus TaxID=76066 RepID=A0AAV7CEQ2_ENGPU|nr:hypothetical protein GDO81_008138 [Engystomops pustulosus]
MSLVLEVHKRIYFARQIPRRQNTLLWLVLWCPLLELSWLLLLFALLALARPLFCSSMRFAQAVTL